VPVSWRIAEDLVRIESDDPVTFEEWRSAVDGFSADPAFHPGMGVIHDWRSRTVTVTTVEIERRADYLIARTRSHGSIRWAVVVHRDVDFGMARVGEALVADARSIDFAVFRDVTAAEEWARRGSR
jgi:hypothetical protein